MDVCSWCLRLAGQPLRAGEICDVCVGLCAFAIVPEPEVAVKFYQRSSHWVEQAFSYRHIHREHCPTDNCWWCGRWGQPLERIVSSQDVFFTDPTLCKVCAGLLVPTPPSAQALASVRSSYEQICVAVGG